MKKSLTLLLLALLCPWVYSLAQIVTTEPSPLQEDSKNVVVYFHADQGNKGLAGLGSTAQVYAHTGACVVNASGKLENWKYAPSWGDNADKYKLSYEGPNLWKLTIGDIRSYYGVAADETVKQLAFVFRTGDCKREGKTESNGDIFVDVVDGGFQLALTSSAQSQVVTAATGQVTFTAASTRPATITLSVNGNAIATQAGATTLKGTYTFPSYGDYTVTATADAGAEGTITQSLAYCYVGPAQPAASQTLPAQGATRNADGSISFCIAAPGKDNVLLVGNWNDYKPVSAQSMDYVDKTIDGASFRYFTKTVSGIPTGSPVIYYYVVDGETAVGDPYARLVLVESDDKNIPASVYPNMPEFPVGKGASGTVAVFDDNFGAYEWQTNDFKRPAQTDLVIYEMLFRDFTGTEGKSLGDGTVRAAIGKIPYIKSLGVNAVELLPICEFNGNNSWGYNPNYYFAIDKAYGTAADYKEFIDKCHAEGIAVILDMVFNQSDWQHPWYRMYPAGSNPFYNATAPHAYSVLNDWNQGYPLVRQQWDDVLKYWLEEFRVDGFRFDLVKGLGDNDSYASSSDSATNAYNASRVRNMKRLHDVMREVAPTAYFINENLAGAKEENEMAADGELNWANVNNSGCQYAMGYSSDASLERMWALRDGRTAGSTVAYLESHDEQRLAYKQKQFGVNEVKNNPGVAARRLASAAAQMILALGSHMIWQFSEMGNAQNTKDSNDGNNTSPKIVNWGLLDNPTNAGIVQSYRELIAVRLGNPELFGPDASYTMNCSGWTQRVIRSTYGSKEMIAVINPSVTSDINVTVTFNSASDGNYRILSKSYGTEPSFSAMNGRVSVPANSYVVIGSNDVSEVRDVEAVDGGVSVIAYGGCLYIDGCASEVSVYGIDGALRAREAAAPSHRISLPAGTYILKAGTESRKIAL